MLRRTTAAAACTAALVALIASPADALAQPVDIEVIIASDTTPDADAKVFLAENVTVGDGPELTEDDLVAPSAQCGAVEVDIDPDVQTITVRSTDTDCVAGAVTLVIASEELWTLGTELTSNGLVAWQPLIEGGFEIAGEGDPGDPRGLAAAWWASEGETLVLSGQTVFGYPREVTPDPAPVTPPAPVAPAAPAVPAAAAPARPVVAQPTFAG